MATSQLVTNSLENKINNDKNYGNYADPEKAKQYFEMSNYLRANANDYNLNPFNPNNINNYNTGALINPNLSNKLNNQANYNSNLNANTGLNRNGNTSYNTNGLVNQLQGISNNIGNYMNNMTSKEEYLNSLTSKITDLINSQKQATIGQYNTAYQNELDQLNYAKQQSTNIAKEQQRQIKGTKAQQLLALDQALAKQGLNGSGEAISNRLALDIAAEENANDVGLNLQDQLGEYEMQGLIALRNKDDGIKNALAQIDSDEAQYMLNAYQEAENYNMNLLSQKLNIAKTQADIQNAIDDAKYRQAQFEEGIREFNENLAEQIRQYELDSQEDKRRYEKNFDENVRQFNEELAYRKEYANSDSLESLLGDIEEDTSNADVGMLDNNVIYINKDGKTATLNITENANPQTILNWGQKYGVDLSKYFNFNNLTYTNNTNKTSNTNSNKNSNISSALSNELSKKNDYSDYYDPLKFTKNGYFTFNKK